MPIYEYQCRKCKHRFEKIQKFSDKPLKKCPECGGGLEQLLSAPAVQFKGTGWYVTDYARKSGSGSGKSSSESSHDGPQDSASSTEKSADKSEKTDKTEKKDPKKHKK